jgi:hypothetical protein
MITICAFEPENGATVSTARKRTCAYSEHRTELASRFMAKNPLAKQALPGLREGGA